MGLTLEEGIAIRQVAAQNLDAYIALRDPRYIFTPGFTEPLVSALQDVEDGLCTRLIINAPPQHGKSIPSSQWLPAHFMGRFPEENILGTSYNQNVSSRWGRRVRNIVDTDTHRLIFPGCKLSRDNKGSSRFTTRAGGEYRASSPKGSMTGIGFKLILIDDPHKNQAEYDSVTVRESVHDWFDNTLYPRLAPGGAIVIIHTRWGEKDLTGHCLRNHASEGWRVLTFPVLDPTETKPLFPERYGIKDIAQRRKIMSASAFQAQYMQNPIQPEGGIIKRDWIRTFREQSAYVRMAWSWDTAIKAGQMNDWSVGGLWGETELGHHDLLRLVRVRLEYPELRRLMVECWEQNPTNEVLIEDKASGQQLLQDLHRNTRMPVIAMMPGKDMPNDKVARANLVAPLFEAGKVRIGENAEWRSVFTSEVTGFPRTPHDDILDMTTQYLAKRSGGRTITVEIMG